MKFKLHVLLIVLVLSAAVGYGQAFLETPVRADIRIAPVSSEEYVELEIRLEIRDGVHVYTSGETGFRVSDTAAEGLGKTIVILPETIPYTDATGTTIDVFKEHKPLIRIHKPYTDNGGSSWKWSGTVAFQGCDDTTCYLPQEENFSFSGTIPNDVAAAEQSIREEQREPFYKQGLFWGIIGSFLAGLALGLTPCVYPMVGITVAIIGAGNASRKRTVFLTFMYVLGLSLVYALLGIIVASVGSAVSNVLTSPGVLFPIGAVFILLGLSMFDLFTIQTPSSWGAKVQKLGGKLKGSVAGTFIMGALSAFVVGPCVSGPLIGLITFVADTGKLMTGFWYFFALAWGMGIILFIAGSFSGILPKAGEWMNRVKHVLGVILIWAAFYFTRRYIGETVFATAGIVALALGLHAAGLFTLPEERKPLKWLALLLGIILLGSLTAFTLSAFSSPEPAAEAVDLDAVIRESSKPVLIDFWAPWCVNCKEIKETVLQEPEVKKQLEKFTFIEINVDERPDLKERFSLIGVPAFIFLDKEGEMIGDIEVTGDSLKERILNFSFKSDSGT